MDDLKRSILEQQIKCYRAEAEEWLKRSRGTKSATAASDYAGKAATCITLAECAEKRLQGKWELR